MAGLSCRNGMPMRSSGGLLRCLFDGSWAVWVSSRQGWAAASEELMSVGSLKILGDNKRLRGRVLLGDGVCAALLSADMDFDVALRLFMDAFRPPGEGQKIDRIMQASVALV
jgi:hypothetical protein